MTGQTLALALLVACSFGFVLGAGLMAWWSGVCRDQARRSAMRDHQRQLRKALSAQALDDLQPRPHDQDAVGGW